MEAICKTLNSINWEFFIHWKYSLKWNYLQIKEHERIHCQQTCITGQHANSSVWGKMIPDRYLGLLEAEVYHVSRRAEGTMYCNHKGGLWSQFNLVQILAQTLLSARDLGKVFNFAELQFPWETNNNNNKTKQRSKKQNKTKTNERKETGIMLPTSCIH